MTEKWMIRKDPSCQNPWILMTPQGDVWEVFPTQEDALSEAYQVAGWA